MRSLSRVGGDSGDGQTFTNMLTILNLTYLDAAQDNSSWPPSA